MTTIQQFISRNGTQKAAAEALGISRHAMSRLVKREASGLPIQGDISKKISETISETVRSQTKIPQGVTLRRALYGEPKEKKTDIKTTLDTPAEKKTPAPLPPSPNAIPTPNPALHPISTVLPETGDYQEKVVGERSALFSYHDFPAIRFYLGFGSVRNGQTALTLRARFFNEDISTEVVQMPAAGESIMETVKTPHKLQALSRMIMSKHRTAITSAVTKMTLKWKQNIPDDKMAIILLLDALRGEQIDTSLMRRVSATGRNWMEDLAQSVRLHLEGHVKTK